MACRHVETERFFFHRVVVLFIAQLCDVHRAISEDMKHVLLQMNASGTVCAFAMLSTLRHVLTMEEEEEEEGACGGGGCCCGCCCGC